MFGKKRNAPVARRIDNPMLVAVLDPDPNGQMLVHIDVAQVASGHEAGLILADFAKHFSKALAAAGKEPSESVAMDQLLWMFNAEMNRPTDAAEGGLVQ